MRDLFDFRWRTPRWAALAALLILGSACGSTTVATEGAWPSDEEILAPRRASPEADGAFLAQHRVAVSSWLDLTASSFERLSHVLTADAEDSRALHEVCQDIWRRQAEEFDKLRNLVTRDPSQIAADVDVAMRLSSAALSACGLDDPERASVLLRRADAAIDQLRLTVTA